MHLLIFSLERAMTYNNDKEIIDEIKFIVNTCAVNCSIFLSLSRILAPSLTEYVCIPKAASMTKYETNDHEKL